MHDALNALKPVSAKTSVSSTSSMPKRTSGLSEPKRSMASRQVMRGISASCSPVTSATTAATAAVIAASTSSWLAKLISASSWVNSNW